MRGVLTSRFLPVQNDAGGADLPVGRSCPAGARSSDRAALDYLM